MPEPVNTMQRWEHHIMPVGTTTDGERRSVRAPRGFPRPPARAGSFMRQFRGPALRRKRIGFLLHKWPVRPPRALPPPEPGGPERDTFEDPLCVATLTMSSAKMTTSGPPGPPAAPPDPGPRVRQVPGARGQGWTGLDFPTPSPPGMGAADVKLRGAQSQLARPKGPTPFL